MRGGWLIRPGRARTSVLTTWPSSSEPTAHGRPASPPAKTRQKAAARVAGWSGPGVASLPAGGLRPSPAGGGWNQLVQRRTPPDRCRRGCTSATGSSPDRPKNLYVREDQIRPRLPAASCTRTAASPGRAGTWPASPVTASAQAADLIDPAAGCRCHAHLRPCHPGPASSSARSLGNLIPICSGPPQDPPPRGSRQRVNDPQALARRGQGQCRSRWRRAGPRAVRRCRAAAGVDHPVGGRQLRDIGDRTHPRAVPRGHPQRGDDLVSPPGNSRSGPLRVCPARRGSPSFRPHDHHRTAVRITTRMAIPGKDARPTQRAASGPA